MRKNKMSDIPKTPETPEDIIYHQAELLELILKIARRCGHDLSHASRDVSDPKWSRIYEERAEFYRKVFYPDNGHKNYHSSLINKLEGYENILKEIAKLLEVPDHVYENLDMPACRSLVLHVLQEKLGKKPTGEIIPF